MEKKFLLDLGLSEDIAKKVIVEHAKDIQAEQSKAAAAVSERDGLQTQLDDRDKQLDELKKSSKDNKELESKLSDLQEQNKQQTDQLKQKLADQSKSFKITEALRDSNAHNPKTVLGLLDTDSIEVDEKGNLKNIDDQIKAVKESDPYLFEADQSKNNEHQTGGQSGVQMNFGGNPSGGQGNGEKSIHEKIQERMANNQ